MKKSFQACDVEPLGKAVRSGRSPKITFSFGRNWKDFVEHYWNPDRESVAIASLAAFLKRGDLRDLDFLDVGCGSGLFSLAAYRMGARRVVSVDVDPLSVECTARLRASIGSSENWSVVQGSILDGGCTEGVEPANTVYAWGSLHHTGAMWDAIHNASTASVFRWNVLPGDLQ